MALFEQNTDAEQAVRRLPLLGLSQDAARVLRSPGQVRQQMNCSQRHCVLKGSIVGALLIAPIIITFAVLDASRAIDFGVHPQWATAAAVLFILGGMACGAFMGALAGRAEAEEDTHLYVEGVRCGYTMVMVWIPEHLAERTMNLLRQDGGLGVRICSRARPAPAPEAASTAAAQALRP
jgi:hypothetical protein